VSATRLSVTVGALVSSVKVQRCRAGIAGGVRLARHDRVGAIGQAHRREAPHAPSDWRSPCRGRSPLPSGDQRAGIAGPVSAGSR